MTEAQGGVDTGGDVPNKNEYGERWCRQKQQTMFELKVDGWNNTTEQGTWLRRAI